MMLQRTSNALPLHLLCHLLLQTSTKQRRLGNVARVTSLE